MSKMRKQSSWNYLKLLSEREVDERTSTRFRSKFMINDDFINRLGLEKELEGHTGCVNCLEWNETGTLLASASDDTRFILWDPFNYKALQTYETGHRGNIFTVKFLPKTKDNTIVTGAGDCKIRVHDVEIKETTLVCSCHTGRVKRIATAPTIPSMFWSAAEDGMIMEFDIRAPHACTTETKHVLINFVPHLGRFAEAKCIAINPQRPELIAVGANDPFIRLYDRRMIRPFTIFHPPEGPPGNNWDRYQYFTSRAENNLNYGSAQYFAAGHLPGRNPSLKKKNRNVTATYLTFSKTGRELLVNLGAEQIYLFDIANRRRRRVYERQFRLVPGTSKEVLAACAVRKTTDSNGRRSSGLPPAGVVDSAKLEALRIDANNAFEVRHYTSAIRLYNKAVNLCPNWALLYGNRAAAYMKRGWDGDMYAALRDCNVTLKLDPTHMKAHFRLAKCLYELQFIEEACRCLYEFKIKFPDQAQSRACKALDMDIRWANQEKQPSTSGAVSEEEEEEEEEEFDDDEEDEDDIANILWGSDGSYSKSWKETLNNSTLSDQEKFWRHHACDYETRYCGHCNTTTDIKEANFFGSEGQYIVAGSDDGSFFIWDRYTTNILQILHGDGSIVNCLQPHPTSCLLATSGIDPVVRLWSPRPEDGSVNDRMVLNLDGAATENQRRMNADPFEMVLINMGFRLAADTGEGDGESYWVTSPSCRTS